MTINWKIWKDALRDAAIIFAIIMLGGLVVGFSGIDFGQAGIFETSVGVISFTIIGCITKHERSEHLPRVAVLLWLFFNVLIGQDSQSWLFSIIGIGVWMLLGVGLSYIFVRNTSPSPKVESAGSES
jgi:hypothetical protein